MVYKAKGWLVVGKFNHDTEFMEIHEILENERSCVRCLHLYFDVWGALTDVIRSFMILETTMMVLADVVLDTNADASKSEMMFQDLIDNHSAT